MAEALTETHNMALPQLLEGFNPCLTGSYPLGLAAEDSDLDYVCQVHDFVAFTHHATEAFGHRDNFMIELKPMHGGTACVVMFESPNGYPVEIVGQPVPSAQNYAYIRMVVLARLLALAGAQAKAEVIKLKKNGYDTDAAFATLLGVDTPLPEHYPAMYHMDDTQLSAFVRLDRLAKDGLV
jgi:hypothetical protein